MPSKRRGIMNILDAIAHLKNNPYTGVIYRESWNEQNVFRYVHLVGNPDDANGKSMNQPECYSIQSIHEGYGQVTERRYEFGYCDIVADDWEVKQ